MLTAFPGKSTKITCVCCNGNQIDFKSEKGITRITIYKDDVVRVSYTENETFDHQQGTEFAQPDYKKAVSVKEVDDAYLICTEAVIVRILKKTASVSLLNIKDESVIFSETEQANHSLEAFDVYKPVGNIKVEEIKTADGVKKHITAADKEYEKTLYHTKVCFDFSADEKIFGLGQEEEGLWNLRGSTHYLHQANKKIAIPFFVSSKGYGILFTTQSPSIFEDTQFGSYFYTTADYYLDYFIIASQKSSNALVSSEIISRMRFLTGKALIPPKYAFGYVQSQERYETQQEILDTAAEFKKRNIPLSLIVLDWLSWDDGMWGQKSFDKSRFPDTKAMVKKLNADNVHFMISIWPSMDEKSQNYKEMKAQNRLLNGINICNAFDEAARKLYWKQAKVGLAENGVESWWCDSSEPMTPEWNHMEKPLPQNQFQEFVNTAQDVMPLEKSNAYGLYHAKGMFEGQKADYPDRRMLILTRSGYPGSQKYGVTLWSGDTSATWDVYKNQITTAIQFSMSGIPYWTVDIGAFFVKKGCQWYWNGDYDDTVNNPGFRELYTRWFQFGAFLPMFRAHGTDCRREPWAFCDETNEFYNSITDFIKLRYRLMPYIYSVAGEVWKEDKMFIRPLFMEFSDKQTMEISKQYMFGPSIMVCPVLEPLYFDKNGNKLKKEKTMKVYLPADCNWYDWWTGKKYRGGQWIQASAEINKMPLFVKEGSVIPVENGEILRFPDENGKCQPFMLYDDKGEGYGYLAGDYNLTVIK